MPRWTRGETPTFGSRGSPHSSLQQEKMKVKALTGHKVNLLKANTPYETKSIKGRPTLIFVGDDINDWIEIQVEGTGIVPEVVSEKGTLTHIELNNKQIPLEKTGVFKEIKDLPEPEEGTIFVASSFTQATAKEKLGRSDIYSPQQLVCTLDPKTGATTVVGTLGLKQ